MIHIEFLLEEPSTEAVLQILVPKMMPESTSFACHVLGGKKTLLKELPTRLRGYANWLPPNWRIMVLVDQDEEDCKRLKERLEKICQTAGLIPRTSAGDKRSAQVINRIVVEELEAWFFGDVTALRKAYPRLPDISRKSAFRNPNSRRDLGNLGTSVAKSRLLQRRITKN